MCAEGALKTVALFSGVHAEDSLSGPISSCAHTARIPSQLGLGMYAQRRIKIKLKMKIKMASYYTRDIL